MKNKLLSIAVVFVMMILSACDFDLDPSSFNHSAGKTNEMVLVVNKPDLRQDPIAIAVKEYFQQPHPLLPQNEPMFDVSAVPEKHFTSSGFMKKHHNILWVNIDPSLKRSFVESRKDIWSMPQGVVKFNVTSDTAFFRLFDEYKEGILSLFDEIEIARTMKTMHISLDPYISADVKKTFDFNIEIPGGFQLSEKTDDIIWLTQQVSRPKQDVTVGLLFYQQPYTTEAEFSLSEIVARRDSITKRIVAGPTKGSYMKVAKKYMPPQAMVTGDYVTDYAVETRGLWELEGDFMGGPFISYTFMNPTTNMLITVDGFVYNPNNKKAVYVRQLQSIMHSITF